MTVTDAAISLGYAPVGLDPVAFNNGDGTFLIGLEAFCPGAAETGHCVALLLFVNDGYVGASDEARTINNVRTVPGSGIAADFPDYSDGAPMCCPNLWTTYVFSWDGAALVTAKGPSSPGAPTATPPVAETPEEDPIDVIYREAGLDGLVTYIIGDRHFTPGTESEYRRLAHRSEAVAVMVRAMKQTDASIAHVIEADLRRYIETGSPFYDMASVFDAFVESDADTQLEGSIGLDVSLALLAERRSCCLPDEAIVSLYLADSRRASLVADYLGKPEGITSGRSFLEYLLWIGL